MGMENEMNGLSSLGMNVVTMIHRSFEAFIEERTTQGTSFPMNIDLECKCDCDCDCDCYGTSYPSVPIMKEYHSNHHSP